LSIKPKLGLFDLTMIIVSLVIGIGIFRSPAIVAQKAGSPLIFYTAWILGGLISICGALTFAEIGSRYPVAGGFYKIFSHCYHPAYAFMLNWSLVIINAASSVGVAIVGAEYINPILMPASLQNDIGIKCTAVVAILILYALNFLGIKMGARTQNILSMIKIAMIVVFCCAVFGPHSHAATIASSDSGSGLDFAKALGVSLISVFFTYGGYQSTINFGADIKDPSRNIPSAIFMGIGLIIVMYMAINVAYCQVLGFAAVQQSKLLAAELAGAFFGPVGYTIASLAIFISVLGFINTSMMSNPRVYYAMGEDKILPAAFMRINEKTMTQEFGLSFFVALMLISLFMLGTFEKIVNYVMFIDSLSLVSAAGTIFIFRSRAKQSGETESPGIYKLRFYPLVPILFMLVLFIVMANVLLSDTRSALYGFTIFLAGYPLYLLLKKSLNTGASH
jgi:APA family basic amino acid/polyamine antiporter